MRLLVFILFLLNVFTVTAADYLVFEENGRYGLKDDQGKVVISPAFERVGWSDGSFSVVGQITGYMLNGQWGLINMKEQRITKAEFTSLVPSGGDRFVARKKVDAITSKLGCIDLKGTPTVPFRYDGIKIDGLRAIVFIKNGSHYLYGVIKLDGGTIIPMTYKNIFSVGNMRYGVQNDENKTALFSETGTRITAFSIDSISSFVNNKAVIYENSLQGVINRDGIIEVQPAYREIIFEGDGIRARKANTWKVLDQNNNVVKTTTCDHITPSGNSFIVENNGLYGISDDQFKEVVPAAYHAILQLQDDLLVVKRGVKSGLVKKDNSVVMPLQFDSIHLSGRYVRASESLLGKPVWSLYDIYGIKKSERTYESMSPFNDKFFTVKNYGLSGVMDKYGKETIHCLYDSILDYNDGQLVVKFHGHYGIIDFRENWLLPPQPFPVHLVDESHYLLKQYNTTFFKTFKDDLIYFSDNNLTIEDQLLKEILPDGTIKKISFEGITISRSSPPILDDTQIIAEESEGLRGIKRKGKFGFIDKEGRLRIANRYESISNFHNGLAAVRILGKWGFVDKQDKIAINPSYEEVSDFLQDVAIVKRGKFGIINKDGNLVLDTRYDAIHQLKTQNFIVGNNNLKGLASRNGEILIDPRFDDLEDLGNGYVIVKRENKYGLLTREGLSVIPMIYDHLEYLPRQQAYLVKETAPWVKLSTN
ncbi:MAG: WG repeat-containing protein [Cyclobacteriaceae bacterium]|nr:WG repeat-containing protein [Cyclobacteriaceae bacterium]